MASLTYTLPNVWQFINTDYKTPRLLRDGVCLTPEELAAYVSSGDYFATLATRLDTLSQHLCDKNEIEQILLQGIVDDLLYLQDHYTISKKSV